jgi:ParB family chromosome partitioning protein
LLAVPQNERPTPATLPLTALRPNRLQPRGRFEEAGLEELAQSIRAQGVVQPLVVAPLGDGIFTIVAGERRWRAAQLAGLDSVPVVVREVTEERELLELALVENLQRSDLNVMEEAEAYQMLRETFQLSQEAIAERVGRGRPTISNTLRLLRLPAEVQELLRQGRLTAGQARPLLSLPSPRDQIRAGMRAAEKGLSARQLEALVAVPRRNKTKRKPQEVHTAAAAERLTRALRTKVEITRRGRAGVVRIHFHSEDELMRIYDILNLGGGEA